MKHVFTLLTFAFLSSGLAQVPDYIPESGLIGWYPLDGSLESSIDPTQDGFLDGPVVTQDRFGNPNGALSFDGVDDFGTIDHYSAFENCAEMTISVWVNPATYPSNVVYCGGGTGASYLFLRKWSSTNESRTFEMALTNWAVGSTGPLADGYLGFCNNGGCWGPGEMNGVGSWSDVPVNSWTHLAYVIGSDSSWVYVNGEVLYADTEGAAPNGLTTSNNPIYLGRAIGSFAQCQSVLNGKLDDIGFWNRALTEEEILSMYLSESLVQGCMDPMGCNFNPEAEEDDGSCDYTCCPGPGCCDVGMHWDWDLGMCQITNVADTNLDGCVQLNDLLDVLSAYGDCGGVELPMIEDALYVIDNSIFTQAQEFTIAARAAFKGADSYSIIYRQIEGGEMKLSHSDGVLNFQVKASFGNCYTASGWVYAQTALADEDLHHIVATYNRTEGEISLSVDGEVRVIQNVNDGDLADCNLHEAAIGNESVQDWRLAEIAFYEFAWTADQIEAYSACVDLVDLDFDAPIVLLPIGTSPDGAAEILESYEPLQILGSPGVVTCE